MLIENTNSAASTASANVVLAAFKIAVVQARVFNDRAEKTAKEPEQNSEEAQLQLRESSATARGGLDIKV